MAKMERVAVWSLMSGGGSGRDVFTVRFTAFTAWNGRALRTPQFGCRCSVMQSAGLGCHWVRCCVLACLAVLPPGCTSTLALLSYCYSQHSACYHSLDHMQATLLKVCSACCLAVRDVVPQEASISWEKRQAEVRAKLQQQVDANAWTSWFDNLAGEAYVQAEVHASYLRPHLHKSMRIRAEAIPADVHAHSGADIQSVKKNSLQVACAGLITRTGVLRQQACMLVVHRHLCRCLVCSYGVTHLLHLWPRVLQVVPRAQTCMLRPRRRPGEHHQAATAATMAATAPAMTALTAKSLAGTAAAAVATSVARRTGHALPSWRRKQPGQRGSGSRGRRCSSAAGGSC